MRRYRFLTCDVFTTSRFGGNQLAVVPEADGLDSAEMQQIAREFNYSESAFVFPSDKFTRRVRIFTPSIEVPFAGHPNIGTAFALAQLGEFGGIGEETEVVFDEAAGPVSITLRSTDGDGIWCELAAPQQLSTSQTVEVDLIARALCLDPDDIETGRHVPQVASVGLPFLMVEVKSIDALRRARAAIDVLEELRAAGITPDVHVYTRSNDDFDIRARMFAPLDGVPEDPATGSANCALAAFLAQLDESGATEHAWHIAQGVEMGRPSVLEARTRRDDNGTGTWIGGYSVLVSDGQLLLD